MNAPPRNSLQPQPRQQTLAEERLEGRSTQPTSRPFHPIILWDLEHTLPIPATPL